MHSARVLWYLWVRQLVNGVKRAVSTPRRLISILIGIGYYVGFFMRPWASGTAGPFEQLGKSFKFQASAIEPIIFLVFCFISFVCALAIFTFKNTFKQSDVDVLFSLPVSSRVVMFFRLFRDYALTLFIPMLFGILLFQPTKGFLTGAGKNDASAIPRLIQGGLVAWLLLTLAWISISYAMCFFVAKHEKKSDRITRTLNWSIFVVLLLVMGSIVLQFREEPTFSTIQSATSPLWMKGLMVLPSAATAIVMGGFSSSPIGAIVGILILVATIWVGLSYAAKLSGWMYDQAATKGHQGQAMRDFQRKGDMTAIVAERARQGKVGKGRLAKRVANWKFRGGWTLLYKEILIQARIGYWINLIFLIFFSAFGIMFLNLPAMSTEGQPNAYIYLAITGLMAVNMSSIQAFNGFVETLKRVEVMKPLPLTSAQIAFFETASKAIISMFMAATPFVVGLIYKPSLWQFHLAGVITAPSMALALVSAVFLTVVLFPDFDDPTQRSFRGIMQLIALLVVMMPTTLIFVGLALLNLSPLVPAVISVLANIAITALLTTIAGRFYADFNPSE